MAMEHILTGVMLRPVTPPLERNPTEEKVVDIQSELRQKMQKRNKQEVIILFSVSLPFHLHLLLFLCVYFLSFFWSFFTSSCPLLFPLHSFHVSVSVHGS